MRLRRLVVVACSHPHLGADKQLDVSATLNPKPPLRLSILLRACQRYRSATAPASLFPLSICHGSVAPVHLSGLKHMANYFSTVTIRISMRRSTIVSFASKTSKRRFTCTRCPLDSPCATFSTLGSSDRENPIHLR